MRVAHSCEQKREREKWKKKERAEPKKYDVERENNIYINQKIYFFQREREKEKKHNIHIYTI